MMDGGLWKHTDEDIIREYRTSDDPIIRHLVERLVCLVEDLDTFEDKEAFLEERIEKQEHEENMVKEEMRELAENMRALLDGQNEVKALLADVLRMMGRTPACTDKPVKEAAKPLKAITAQDVRDALLAVQAAHGRDKAIGVITQFSGGSRKLSAVPEDKRADVLAACEALNGKAVA